MNNSKHTPGPWTVGCQRIVQDPRNGSNIMTQVIETSLGEIELIDGTNEPDYNSRLIAAAPCLLEALEALQRIATETTKDIVGFDGAEALDDAIDKAREAIAKATI